MKYFPLVALLLLIGNVGQAQVTLIDSFVHGGIMRTYRLYIPAVYNGTSAVPIVLNLHGYTSNGMQQEIYGDFRPIADTANFIIAHPDGSFDGNNNRFWNAFGAASPDDKGFLSALLDTIIANYNINQNRIYATGMSNGGYMSYLLACSMSERIAAIASVTGTMTQAMKTNCLPSHPMPVMVMHGTADPVVPYVGNASGIPIDSVITYWVGRNHCNATPIFTAVPNLVLADGCTAEHYLFQGGDLGSTVEFYKILGGGHTWPGAPIAVGVTNMDISGSAEIWRFFSKYSLDHLASGLHNTFGFEIRPFFVYPNPSPKNCSVYFPGSEKKRITIFNEVGQCIQSVQTTKASFSFEVSNSGIYFIRVMTEDQVQTQKIIIE